jgi:hypothetical protein
MRVVPEKRERGGGDETVVGKQKTAFRKVHKDCILKER